VGDARGVRFRQRRRGAGYRDDRQGLGRRGSTRIQTLPALSIDEFVATIE